MEKKTGISIRGFVALRIIFYIIIVALIVWLVIMKKTKIIEAKNAEKITIFSEWEKNGIPVNTWEVQSENFIIFKQTTAEPLNGNILKAFVTYDVVKELNVGQKIIAYRGKNSVNGHISEVNSSRNLSNGLFEIIFTLSSNFPDKNVSKVFIKINTKEFKNVITLPLQSLIKENEESFVWKVSDNKAVKTPIKTGISDGFKTIIKSGLKKGDFVVFEGQKNLNGTQKINSYKCMNCS